MSNDNWKHYVMTSVDDCRSSLQNISSPVMLPDLRRALDESLKLNHKTRAIMLRRKISQLEKAEAHE